MGEAVHRPLPQPTTTKSPCTPYRFLTANQLPFPRPHLLPTCVMDDQSRSTRFRTLFDSALRAYKEKTGITLAEHSLAMQLQSCTSVESITSLIQDQIRTSSDSGGADRIMNSIGSTISILSTVSATAVFDWAINMVSQKVLTTCFSHR